MELQLLDGLLPNERYSVVIRARNRIGTGPPSQPIQFIMVEGGKGQFLSLFETMIQPTAYILIVSFISWTRFHWCQEVFRLVFMSHNVLGY